MTKKLIATLIIVLSSTYLLVPNANAQSWDITGNSGTSSSNFIGTLDPEPLNFVVDNTHAGTIGIGTTGSNSNLSLGVGSLNPASPGLSNTSIGTHSMFSNAGSIGNTSLGFESLYDNMEGNYNVSMGYRSLFLNTTGYWNTSLGSYSLVANNGNRNVSIGGYSLWHNTSGSNNTSCGYGSLASNTIISELVAIGYESLTNNGTGAAEDGEEGKKNTAVGFQSLYSNTIGFMNTSSGYQSLFSNVSGVYNNAIGVHSLYSNIDGDANIALGVRSLYSNDHGAGNVAVGHEAMFSNTSGIGNIAVGNATLYNNSSGICNTVAGNYALEINDNGSYNVAIGEHALHLTQYESYNTVVGAFSYPISGSFNSALGAYTYGVAGPYNNTTAIGFNTHIDADNQVHVGDYNITEIAGMVNFTTYSDARFKKNIQQNVPGLEFIKKITPVTYTVDVRGIGKYREEAYIKNLPANKREETIKQRGKIKELENPEASTIVYTGFLAQDVERAAKELNYDFSGVDEPKNEDGLYGLRYSDFIPPVFKAIQEQQDMIDNLTKQNDELNQKIERLERIIYARGNEKLVEDNSNSNMKLSQNIPNPFANDTKIRYSLDESGEVTLVLLNSEGMKIRELEQSVKMKGEYEYNLDGRNLRPGVYYYILKLNGKQLSKKAIKI